MTYRKGEEKKKEEKDFRVEFVKDNWTFRFINIGVNTFESMRNRKGEGVSLFVRRLG